LNRVAIAPNAQIPRLVFTRRPYRLALADDAGATATRTGVHRLYTVLAGE
jgi:hypothetical protein